MNNEELDALLEEKSLYWNDDKEVVDTFVLKTIKRFEQENKADQELLPEYKDLEDRDFARKLFRSTILNCDQYQRYMSDASATGISPVWLTWMCYYADCHCRDGQYPKYSCFRHHQ